MYITAQGCRLRNDLYCFEWDVKLYYTIPYLILILVLQIWCCLVKHDLVMLVVIMKVKDTATVQLLFIVSLFRIWNITTVEINSGVHLLKS